MTRRSKRAFRNLADAWRDAARFTAKTARKATRGLCRWVVTDHSPMSGIEDIPGLGFIDTVKFVLLRFLVGIVAAVVGGIWIFLMIAYGVPLLLDFLFL